MDPAHNHAAEYRELQYLLEELQTRATLTQLEVYNERYLDTPNDLGDLAALLSKIRMGIGILETLQIRLGQRIDNLAHGKESGT